LSGADLTRTNLQGVQFWETKLLGTVIDNADFRGVQCVLPNSREAFRKAVITGTGLKTDLSGLTLYDDDGNELDLTEEGKKEWFRNHGAKVDDLSPKEVQDLYNDLKDLILQQQPDFEENEEFSQTEEELPPPVDVSAESQDSDNP